MSLTCYNKGCGQKFDPDNNADDACKYHPGGPIFHDALKGWSCCKKRSTDFTEFLNTPGCTRGPHSNVKPVQPQETKTDSETDGLKNITLEEAVKPPRQRDPLPKLDMVRPSADEPMLKLKVTVTSSLKAILEKLQQEDSNVSPTVDNLGEISVGTNCYHKSCKTTYNGPKTNDTQCVYHPGYPVFHEGMKYWTCCQRKTSDFDNFLSQEGCEVGKHLWIKPKGEGEEKSCRFDWYQTGPDVCISFFAKASLPEKTLVEANKVVLKVHLVFDGGKSVFDQQFILWDAIDPERSNVKLLGSKVEINLKKKESFSWPTLELPKDKLIPTGDKNSQ
ncbi:cysteine and histidine-rich domain-containing protein 1-like [Gigantopelta aegis]|uniref:cysteine and histidine-rich domain-containing protein 1-like n=1 Tax=Gigantopelta aegis TaxID=1735272 RepID=UPI001B887E00|nr:cysteine and histidine-rich domain-containing protein 1-like [Gigantopelta aegis]